MKIKTGDKVPDFEGLYHYDKKVSLSDFKCKITDIIEKVNTKPTVLR